MFVHKFNFDTLFERSKTSEISKTSKTSGISGTSRNPKDTKGVKDPKDLKDPNDLKDLKGPMAFKDLEDIFGRKLVAKKLTFSRHHLKAKHSNILVGLNAFLLQLQSLCTLIVNCTKTAYQELNKRCPQGWRAQKHHLYSCGLEL